jgi:hypothetical protein
MTKHQAFLWAIALAVILSVSPAPAQNKLAMPSGQPTAASDEDIQMMRQNLRDTRKKVVAANMNLTADEATKFWPIYDQYQQELNKIGDVRWQLMRQYAASYPNVSPDQAQTFMTQSTATDQQMIALRDKYVQLFEKVIPPKKAALWYQIDRQIDLIVNLQMASVLPLVDASK